MTSISDHFMFLRDWVSNPFKIGAIAPSSLSLAHLITGEISPQDAPVVELGPGTGVFTRRLIQRGISQEKIVLIENSKEFADLLAWRFPEARLLCRDAASMESDKTIAPQTIGAIVSGLPLVSMPVRKVISILRFAFESLRLDGSFYQFTYGLRCPIHPTILERCQLQATHIGSTLINVPPASVYKISRRTT